MDYKIWISCLTVVAASSCSKNAFQFQSSSSSTTEVSAITDTHPGTNDPVVVNPPEPPSNPGVSEKCGVWEVVDGEKSTYPLLADRYDYKLTANVDGSKVEYFPKSVEIQKLEDGSLKGVFKLKETNLKRIQSLELTVLSNEKDDEKSVDNLKLQLSSKIPSLSAYSLQRRKCL